MKKDKRKKINNNKNKEGKTHNLRKQIDRMIIIETRTKNTFYFTVKQTVKHTVSFRLKSFFLMFFF